MNARMIVIDGKIYNSVNEMPPDVREKYEQAMKSSGNWNLDSTPNVFESAQQAQVVSNMMRFVVDGKEYNSIQDLPPEARAKYEQAMGALDKNQNGMPDFLEGMIGMTAQSPSPQSQPMTTRPPRPALQPASPTISPDTSNGWTLVLVGGALLLLCVVGAFGVWFFLLR